MSAQVLANHLPFGDDDEPIGINAQADALVGEGRRHAVAVALEDERDRSATPRLLYSTKPSKGRENGIRLASFASQASAIVPGSLLMGRLAPQLLTAPLQPFIQGVQRGKVRHRSAKADGVAS